MREVYPGGKSLREKLTFLHEYFSRPTGLITSPEKYRRGHHAGMTFARLCVLNELGAHTDKAGNSASDTSLRLQEDATLAAITERLDHEYEISPPLGGDQFSAGYHAGIAVARNYTTMVRESPGVPAGRLRR